MIMDLIIWFHFFNEQNDMSQWMILPFWENNYFISSSIFRYHKFRIRSWKSLEAVRKGHLMASKYASKNKSGFISQRDMVLTQFGFMGFIVLKPHKLGIQLSNKDFEAFVHFWRVIGHLIGIQDRFNVCTDSYRETRIRLKRMLSDIYRPYLEETGDDFMIMSKALIEGLWCFNPMLDTDASIYLTKWISGCKNYVYYESDPKAADIDLDDSRKIIQSYGWYTRWIIYLEITAHTYLVNFFPFRWYFNNQVWISQHIIYWFPFLAFYKFGIKQSYVRILKGVKWSDDIVWVTFQRTCNAQRLISIYLLVVENCKVVILCKNKENKAIDSIND